MCTNPRKSCLGYYAFYTHNLSYLEVTKLCNIITI